MAVLCRNLKRVCCSTSAVLLMSPLASWRLLTMFAKVLLITKGSYAGSEYVVGVKNMFKRLKHASNFG